MKTNENIFLYVLRLAGTLFLITALVAAALAGVNAVTAPIIAELNAAATQEAISAVLPGGFDTTITMMVGVDNEGKVLGISVVSHTETAGLGAVAAAETPKGVAFREQFVGTTGEVFVTKDGGQMDAITGATITSRAVCVGVSAAQKCVAGLG